MKLSQLKIDPEFQSKIPPLQFEEEQQLEQNIIAEGRLLNPIITWNGYILDGHTRYRILKKHGFIKFEVEEIQLANKYEALRRDASHHQRGVEGQCGFLPCRCNPGCGPLHLRIRGRVQPGAAGEAAGKDTPENHHAAGTERRRQFCKPPHAADSPHL